MHERKGSKSGVQDFPPHRRSYALHGEGPASLLRPTLCVTNPVTQHSERKKAGLPLTVQFVDRLHRSAEDCCYATSGR